MKLFTFDAYAQYLRPSSFEYARRNLIMNDRVPFDPFYVVDDAQARSHPRYTLNSLESYGIAFQDQVHMAPDRTTVYFVNEQDALMFMLALS